ncbi:MAG: hypothetical protein JWO05_1011 [Gemmatimonadetes bacterium]|nr:hypothetical protein [Gemmatimonadota bacterium]
MHLRATVRLAQTLAIVVPSLFVGGPSKLRAQNWRPVDRVLSRMVDSGVESISPRRVTRLWIAFDGAITAALNAPMSLDSLNRILIDRPGYEGPSPGQATLRLPNATFWRELPRDAPDYFIAAIDSSATTLLSVVHSPSVNGPSHLSVFQRRHGRWTRTGSLSSPRSLSANRISIKDGRILLITLETWTRADGSESWVKLWRLSGGQLARIERNDTTQLQDADVEPKDGAVVIRVSQFPRYVGACTMCTRLYYEYSFSALGTGIRERRESLNPWASLVDSLYSLTAKGNMSEAKALLLPRVSLSSVLGKTPQFASDTGDFRAGTGHADIAVGALQDCARYWRFRSVRQPNGQWRIAGVRPGRWTGDSIVFDQQASPIRQPKGRCS